MCEWYGNAVGLKPNHYGPFGAWLTNDAANHRVAMLVAPGLDDDPAKIAHTGMHHLAFEYPDIDGLLDTYDRLKGGGIRPHACLDHGLTTSLYYVDPDGNSVELQADNFGDWGASSEWMRTAPGSRATRSGSTSIPIGWSPRAAMASTPPSCTAAASPGSSIREPRWTCGSPRPRSRRRRSRPPGFSRAVSRAPTLPELLGRIEEIRPMLERNAGQTEADRRVTEENIDALTAAGAFKVTVPRRFGGFQMTVREKLGSRRPWPGVVRVDSSAGTAQGSYEDNITPLI